MPKQFAIVINFDSPLYNFEWMHGSCYGLLHICITHQINSNSSRSFYQFKKKIKKKIDFPKNCNIKISIKSYYNMRYNLPMKMSYFDQLFEMVGLDDLS